MVKKILLLITIILLITSFSYAAIIEEADYYQTNDLTGYTLVINDDANLLSANQINLLKSDMYPLTEYGNIVFYSTTIYGSNTKQKANDYYYDLFRTNTGSVLIIDMAERYVFIYSDGENLKSLNQSKSEIITDNIYTYLRREAYYDGAKRAFSEMHTVLERW